MRQEDNRIPWATSILVMFVILGLSAQLTAAQPWVEYKGMTGPGQGKRIVLISGDEEYRSEEALPQLGKILAKRHGFHCTVLFAVDPETGLICPNVLDNIPGLQALTDADLMIIFTRFRALPDDQMKLVDTYLRRGGPVIGIRTATHAFKFPKNSPWAHYGNGYKGPKQEWTDGFGRLVLGEKWISHHGKHKHESSRGVIAPGMEDHPIARGLQYCDIWGPSDVYGVRLPLPGDSEPVILGQVLSRKGAFDDTDPHYGMRPDDGPPVAKKNQPMMPIAWTKTYQIPGGLPGRAFTSTIGAATDLVSAGTRRLLVNAVYWCLDMEQYLCPNGAWVELVDTYEPNAYGFRKTDHWQQIKVKPSDYAMK